VGGSAAGGAIPSTSRRAITVWPEGKHGMIGGGCGGTLPSGHTVIGRRQVDGMALWAARVEAEGP